MVNRYEVALLFKNKHHLLNWKGDTHTNGIYFDDKNGYLLEPTYAVKVQHDQPAPSIFYVPSAEEEIEGEVYVDFPYINMKRKPNKYHYLFKGPTLKEEEITQLFHLDATSLIELEPEPLIHLLKTIPKKRVRDRSWFVIKEKNGETEITLFQKEKNDLLPTNTIQLKNKFNLENVVVVNANTILHALNLFSLANTVLFFITHDRIKITSNESPIKVEAVLTTPKESIKKEIDAFYS